MTVGIKKILINKRKYNNALSKVKIQWTSQSRHPIFKRAA